MPTKICPLLRARLDGDLVECQKEKCTWWKEEKNLCSIVIIADGLSCYKDNKD